MLTAPVVARLVRSFSALQRAENSSMLTLQIQNVPPGSFSALQRAENSSIHRVAGGAGGVFRVSVLFSEPKIPQFAAAPSLGAALIEFQCSSASRKFLNIEPIPHQELEECFSALQRAENSSIKPRLIRSLSIQNVSVLFSEPKIPQSTEMMIKLGLATSFSALQRAENSSIAAVPRHSRRRWDEFQCSSASRKFLN